MSAEKYYDELAGQKVNRIEAISDGVFAIALTLLVLEIKVPAGKLLHSEGELINLFLGLAPRFVSYFLSFMTLGIFWTGQMLQFTYITKSDRNLNWISLFFLMFVSILPFTTAFLSDYIEFKFAIGLYWLNLFALGLFLLIQWKYSVKANLVSVHGEQREQVSRIVVRRILIAQSLYAICALLCFVSTYLSIALIVILQLNYALGIVYRKLKKKMK